MATIGANRRRSRLAFKMFKFFQPYNLFFLVLMPLFIFLMARSYAALSKRRKVISVALRIIVFSILVLSVSGLSIRDTAEQANVIFSLDLSRSVSSESKERALEYIQRAMEEIGGNDTAGLVVFGADAHLEMPPQRNPRFMGISGSVREDATNIAQALQLSIASFPSLGAKRIVLLSDGNENIGNAADLIPVARYLGVEISAVPLESAIKGQEIYVERISIPRRIKAGQPYEVRVTVSSQLEDVAKLQLFKDGTLVNEEEISLKSGTNTFAFKDSSQDVGFHKYEALVDSPRDTISENNRGEAFVEVVGPPRVLYAYGDRKSDGLLKALRAQGIEVEEVSAQDIPSALSELLAYSLLIFDDVSGFEMSEAKMELVERYVRDLGGGVIMLGGEQSFGAGGYYGTPVERILPVNMDAATRVNLPSLSLVFVLDKSGSMAESTSGKSKLDLAKGAAFSAIELLNPFDRVGLIAFDSEYKWVVPIVEAANKEDIVKSLSSLTAGGGTRLYEPLEEAIATLEKTEASVKHLIALSDGLTEEADFKSLVKRAASSNITVSTVAVGKDADLNLMRNIASWGNGRSYYTVDPSTIPQIFITEAIIVSRKLIVEKEFRPLVGGGNEILSGIDWSDVPTLLGYVSTFPKPSAEMLMMADPEKGDPLMAVWQYGLGRSGAFTSDLGEKWGRNWLNWEDFGRFVAQFVRWTERKSSMENFVVDTSVTGERGKIKVDLLDEKNNFINFVRLNAIVISSDGQTETIPLEQSAPGEYTGKFGADRSGEYFITLFSEDGMVAPKTVVMSLPYSSEYVKRDANIEFLKKLAQSTGGRIASLNDDRSLRDLTRFEEESFRSYRGIWFPLIVAALLLFLLDIAVRKVTVPEELREHLISMWLFIARRQRERKAVSYREAAEMMIQSKERKQEMLRKLFEERRGDYQNLDPTTAARLYLARMRTRRMEQQRMRESK
ncbi:MAG: VWA domain-containing protein [bacterium]